MQLQRPAFIQEQRFKMSPQLYQSIELMALPIVDLREKIEEEIERNPALEVLEDRTTISLDAAYSPRKKDEDDYFEVSSDSGFVSRGGDEAADEQHKFIEGALSRSETLQEHLLWNLRLVPAGDDVRRIAERLIQNLDEDGFHKEPVELLLKDEAPGKTAQALSLVRALDPPGTATTGYRESLLVQARLLPDAPEGMEAALDCLELLERGKLAEVARKINRTEAEVQHILDRIKALSPFPGRQFASAETRYVVPDIQVLQKEGEFIIVLNDEEIPVLGINPFFMQIAADSNGRSAPKSRITVAAGGVADGPDEAKPVRDFVKENIKEARWFIQSINQRNHTLLRVSRAIVEFQRAFFVSGPKYLAPLTLRDIAQELGVHETTVSRTANGKYMQTEWGIFEVRHFFTNSISGAGSGGSRHSKEGVKERIRELISVENRRFSDQEITDLLAKQGIPLARRTVAKYRTELDLGSSYSR
ncbi:RNA polymerase sigma-54 factor [Spirochaetia bacterium]|nr:RNA polymerase sigma-54 factor [Spirochaetia bacterium]